MNFFSFRPISPRRLAATLTLGISALCLSRPAAAQVVLNFDSLTAMGNAPGALVPVTAQLSSQYVNDLGVRFTSGSPFIAIVSLGMNHATSGTNGIGGTNAAGNLSYDAASPIFAEFFTPGTSGAEPGVTSFVSVRADLIGINGPLILRAFDVQGSLIGTSSQTDVNGPTLSLSLAGIHRVSLTGNGSAAFDDFTFNTVTAAPVPPTNTAAPEPGSLALLLPGITAVGSLSLRRRRK